MCVTYEITPMSVFHYRNALVGVCRIISATKIRNTRDI
nr:MAG TPA: hypothetical protein [Caudoviricetes sp.]DAV03535.1 MAG TPA: hypothetical protein [Caudoviricetes sp.]